jgi:hypothetical protein
MKRAKTPYRRTFDPNVQTAYLSGSRARLEGKPLSACPNLCLRFEERYAIKLMDSWMRGWHDRDREKKTGQMTLSGIGL